MSAACFISSASTPSRPAVSTITTSYSLRLASSIEARATATGSPAPLPGLAGGPGYRASPPSPATASATRWPSRGGEDRYAGPLAVDLQLVHRVGALQVRRDQHRGLALGVLQPVRELRGQR